MKDIKQFRGCLQEFSFDEPITQEKIDYLLKNKIYEDLVGDFDKLSDEDKEHYENTENDISFGTYFTYNKREYSLNKDILYDIYDIIFELIRKRTLREVTDKKIEIEITCRSILNKSSKIKYLEESYKNLFNKPILFEYYEAFKNRSRATALFYLHVNETSSYFNLIKFYLQEEIMSTSGFYHDFKVRMAFLKENDAFIYRWILYYKTRSLEVFILSKINELDSVKKNIKKSLSYKSQKPLYQVLFIDVLRKVRNEPYYSDNNLEKYLGHLTGYEFEDKEFQIDTLKKLIHLDDIKYDQLKATHLGNFIYDITGKDAKSLIRNSAIITKKAKDYTPKQKISFKNKSLLERKIRSTIKALR